MGDNVRCLFGIATARARWAILLILVLAWPILANDPAVADTPEPFDLVVLIDVSSSLDDLPNGWLAKAAGNLVVDTLQLVHGSYGSSRIAVVPFMTEVDDDHALQPIADVSMDGVFDVDLTAGTDFKKALEEAQEIFDEADPTETDETRRRVVILISDGQPDVGSIQPGPEHFPENIRYLEETIQPQLESLVVDSNDVEMLVLGIGSTAYEKFWDGDFGDNYRYIPIDNTDDLQLLFQEMAEDAGVPQNSGWVGLYPGATPRRTFSSEAFFFFPTQHQRGAAGVLIATETDGERVLSYPYGGDNSLYVMDELPAGEWEFTLEGEATGEILLSSIILPTATATLTPSPTLSPTATTTPTLVPSVTPSMTPTQTSTPTATLSVVPPGTSSDFVWGRATLTPRIPRHNEPLELLITASISETVRSITARATLLVDGVPYREILLTRDDQTFSGRFDTVPCNRPWPYSCDYSIDVMATVYPEDGPGYQVPKGIQHPWIIRLVIIIAGVLVVLVVLVVIILFLHLLGKIPKWLQERRLRQLQGQLETAKRLQIENDDLSEGQLAGIKQELSELFGKERADLDKLVRTMKPGDHTQIALSVAYFDAILNQDRDEAFAWACQLADPNANDNARAAAGLCLNHLDKPGKQAEFYALLAEKRFDVAILRHAVKATEAR